MFLFAAVNVYNQHTFIEKHYRPNGEYVYSADENFGFKVTDIYYYPNKIMKKSSKNSAEWKEKLRLFRLQHTLNSENPLINIADICLAFVTTPEWEKCLNCGTLVIKGKLYTNKTCLPQKNNFQLALEEAEIKEFNAGDLHSISYYADKGYNWSFTSTSLDKRKFKFNLKIFRIPLGIKGVSLAYKDDNLEIGPVHYDLNFNKNINTFFDNPHVFHLY